MVGDSIDIKGYEDRVKVCMDEAINDLYLISDLLITDYSSVMFDFAILQLPMLFYPYDMAHYKEKLRGFYLDYNEVPVQLQKMKKNCMNLFVILFRKDNFQDMTEKKERFEQLFCSWESGEASQKITNLIVERESN